MKNINNEKIDIVYCWCDGNEEEYRNQKYSLQKKLGIAGAPVNECRFVDNDELKYSLRSLDKFIDWINNIYIVTNNQCPKWLNLDNPKINLINQKDIMPESASPCYNSNAIEHCLVNIPNLSEYFLYANDDFFFLRRVTPEFFFKNGKPIYRYTGFYKRNDGFYNRFLINSEELIYKKFGKRYNRYPHHNIEPYKKQLVKECYQLFKKEIDNTIHSPFRAITDIQKSIYASYALAMKKGVYKVLKINQDLPWFKRIICNRLRFYIKDSEEYPINNKDIIFNIMELRPKLICLNDNENATNEDRIQVKHILNSFFPEKSQFEK